MKKLNKFDNIYNKFIFEWTLTQDLHSILDNIKNNLNEINNNTNYDVVYPKEYDINRTDFIRSEFNDKFPSYLLKKCQSKFPINDNIIIPDNIIDMFWEKYSNLLLDKLADVTISKISLLLYKTFIDLFGNDNEYNEEFCNDSALQLVNLD